MTGIVSITVIIRRPDGYPVAIITEAYRMAGVIIRCFAINIGSDLYPVPALVFIDPYMTGISSITVILGRSNGYPIAIATDAYRMAGVVTGGFSIDIGSKLYPVPAQVFIDPYMTGTLRIIVIKVGSNSYPAPIIT